MATSTLSVPQANLVSPTSWGSRASIASMVDKIVANYGPHLKMASQNSKIPVEVLASFIAVESGGNPTAGGSGHPTQGLMQWNREYAKSQLETELAQGRMSPAEKSKLAEFGIKFDATGKTRVITNADQLKPELNILIGSIILGKSMAEKITLPTVLVTMHMVWGAGYLSSPRRLMAEEAQE
jgi:hypothetical protein